MIIFPSILVILICNNLMIVIFSNLIIGVLKKFIIVIFSNSTIKKLSYSISPIFSNFIIIIYKGFIPEFYNWLISIVERKITFVNYSFFGGVNLKQTHLLSLN